MKKIIRTAGILTMVFAASVAVYFFAARKNMQKVKCPILIIHSKEDDLTSIKSAYNVYNNVSSLEKKIIILENSYHLMLYDNEKDRVYNESLLFLNNIISLGGAKVLRHVS